LRGNSVKIDERGRTEQYETESKSVVQRDERDDLQTLAVGSVDFVDRILLEI
jgi:hypothetical protein